MNDLVTIVIPVYKVEQYLNECVQSIVEQTYENIEIILVDDGSPDNCPIMCDEWAKKDCRIKVIHKKNGGVSSARNVGIETATGEWILFTDADDKLYRNALEKIINLEIETVDMVIANYTRNKNKSEMFSCKTSIVENKEIAQSIFDYKFAYSNLKEVMNVKVSLFTSCWGKFYKKQILIDSKIKFSKELKLSEDAIFNFEYVSNVKDVLLLDECIYYYRPNANSVTSTYSIKHFESNIFLIEYLLNLKILDKSISKARDFYIIVNILRINEKLFYLAKSEQTVAVNKYKKLIYRKEIITILEKNKNSNISKSKYANFYYNYIQKLFLKKNFNTAIKIGKIFGKLKRI